MKVNSLKLHPKEFAFAPVRDNLETVKEFVKLRKQSYADPKSIGFRLFSENEANSYNKSSSNLFTFKNNGVLIGGAKFDVHQPSSDLLLPLEEEYPNLKSFRVNKLFPELNLNEKKYAEFSRLILAPMYRNGEVIQSIFGFFKDKVIELNVEYVFIMTDYIRTRKYHRIFRNLELKSFIRDDIFVPDKESYEGKKMILSYVDLSREVG